MRKSKSSLWGAPFIHQGVGGKGRVLWFAGLGSLVHGRKTKDIDNFVCSSVNHDND